MTTVKTVTYNPVYISETSEYTKHVNDLVNNISQDCAVICEHDKHIYVRKFPEHVNTLRIISEYLAYREQFVIVLKEFCYDEYRPTVIKCKSSQCVFFCESHEIHDGKYFMHMKVKTYVEKDGYETLIFDLKFE